MTVKSDISREDEGGFPCTVYYRDDDNNSGYGENSRIAYWFGSYDKAPADAPKSEFKPLKPWRDGVDEEALAGEFRYD